jgi:hypothetical protein
MKYLEPAGSLKWKILSNWDWPVLRNSILKNPELVVLIEIKELHKTGVHMKYFKIL